MEHPSSCSSIHFSMPPGRLFASSNSALVVKRRGRAFFALDPRLANLLYPSDVSIVVEAEKCSAGHFQFFSRSLRTGPAHSEKLLTTLFRRMSCCPLSLSMAIVHSTKTLARLLYPMNGSPRAADRLFRGVPKLLFLAIVDGHGRS